MSYALQPQLYWLKVSKQTLKNGGHNSALSDSNGTSITIYNQNFGVVKDVRDIGLEKGTNHIKFDDVAAGIDPTSVSFISITAPNSVVVREQNYQYDLMDLDTILAHSVGKNVKFKQTTKGGGERIIEGELLAPPSVMMSDSNGNLVEHSQAIVVKTANGVVISPAGDVELAEVPKGLVAKPCLLWKLDCDKAGEQKAEISYQTTGLNWKCDYVAIDDPADASVDLTSWVTLDNKSGATYNDSSLKLIAGDVHKIQEELYKDVIPPQGADASIIQGLSQFSEESFAEYHLYALAGKTTLHDNETKQLTLFEASAVPVKKLFVFAPAGYGQDGDTQDNKVAVKLEVENSKKNNMGMALPKGTVRFYKRDKDGSLAVYRRRSNRPYAPG